MKAFEKIKNNPKNVTKEQLISLLKYYNCIVMENRGKGGHFMVTHEKIEYSIPIPSDKPIKVYYVKDCIKLIEEVMYLED